MAKIILNEQENFILNKLNEFGKGYVVGGAVRDMLLGLTPKDVDYCTDIDYNKLFEIFKEYSPKKIGNHFGVLQIKIDDTEYEIAKLRIDNNCRTRKDVDVVFTNDILLDLERRDFTINAIAYDGNKLITLNQLSINDLSNKLIRFVGNPTERIIEDPLRIFRAIRFATEKNFRIELDTLNSIEESRELLKLLSDKRIEEELYKIICSNNSSGFKLLYKTKCLDIIFDTYFLECCVEKMTNIMYETDNINVRFAILYKLIDNDDKFKKIINNNKIFKKSKDLISVLSSLEDELRKRQTENVDKYILKKMAYLLKNKEDYIDFLELCKVIKPYLNLEYDIFNDPIYLKDLAVNGNDIKNIVGNTKQIGEFLSKLLDIVHKNPALNKKECLIPLLKRWYNA